MLDPLYNLPVNLALLIFLLGCVGLDALFGDPQGWPHPVRLIGKGLDDDTITRLGDILKQAMLA